MTLSKFHLVEKRVHSDVLFIKHTIWTNTVLCEWPCVPIQQWDGKEKSIAKIVVCCPDEHFKVTVHGTTLIKQVTRS